jgi:2-aminoethylphosphonate-pyruvate transaminase
MPFDEARPVAPAAMAERLGADPSITHVILIHCETGAGVLNPLQEVADLCQHHGKGLIVDAMSSFAAIPIDVAAVPFDALIAASGKCLEGVPGMGFVIVRKAVLEARAGNAHSLAMDLHDQYVYMEKTTQWRYTPPTHVVAALRAAVDQYKEEGGQPARLARYTRNCETLVNGMAELGFRTYLATAVQAPIIVTFHAPADPAYDFKTFYARTRDRGYILYPGKLTQVETFRVGCIGAIDANEMRNVVSAVAQTLKEMDIKQVPPVGARKAA